MGKDKPQKHFQVRSKKRNKQNDGISRKYVDRKAEIATLKQRIKDETPSRGSTPPLSQVVAFRALPLSEATLRGLENAKYTTMTAIQNACIPHALAGR